MQTIYGMVTVAQPAFSFGWVTDSLFEHFIVRIVDRHSKSSATWHGYVKMSIHGNHQ